jgi:DNA polymerase-1
MEFRHAVRVSEGADNAPITFISGVPSWEGTPLSGTARAFLFDSAKRAGIPGTDISLECVLGEIPPSRKAHALDYSALLGWKADCLERLARRPSRLLVPLDDLALETITDRRSLDKWQLSIIPAEKVSGRKTIPIYHPDAVFQKYSLSPFFIYGLTRIREQMHFPEIKLTPRIFHIGNSFSEIMVYLGKCRKAQALSVDIETARGQITCVGIAISPTEAMSIRVLPEDWPSSEFATIWTALNELLSSPIPKIFQNWIYDCSYFSRYGIQVKGIWHDTMHANKFLHPELPCGLDTVARIYTREPYWKDEGKNWKDPAGSGDQRTFWTYNCKDAAVTFEAALAQKADLEDRGLADKFYDYLMRLAAPISEMCWNGLPLDIERRDQIRAHHDAEIAKLNEQLGALSTPIMGKPINSRSPKQIKELLNAKKIRIPTKKGQETTDATALLKLQFKYPADPLFGLLLRLSELNKTVSSYLKPAPYPDGRVRYSINIHGTDTGRFSCSKDPWDNGINAQTVPGDLKGMFRAPPGWLFLECDLKQADARFVAWDAPEPTLITFFNTNRDIHRFVASRPELFNKPEGEISKDERQLGKKTGHAANYGMQGKTHSEACLREMGIVMSPDRAQQMLEGYHRTFPGIRMWQARLREEVRRTKCLTTPMGRERYFYDRLGDDLYRVAYAYRPQSTVADIVNTLMLHIYAHRDPLQLHFLVQVHDSLVMLVREAYLRTAVNLILDEKAWNPVLNLSGGALQIPIEVKAGVNWKEMTEQHGDSP